MLLLAGVRPGPARAPGCCTAQRSAAQDSEVQHHTAQQGTTRHSTVRQETEEQGENRAVAPVLRRPLGSLDEVPKFKNSGARNAAPRDVTALQSARTADRSGSAAGAGARLVRRSAQSAYETAPRRKQTTMAINLDCNACWEKLSEKGFKTPCNHCFCERCALSAFSGVRAFARFVLAPGP